jgi:pyridoxal phosphate enzyme (YggS family)
MSPIEFQLQRIKSSLPEGTKLIVVSKYREIAEIEEVYRCGQREFAENRVQALLERRAMLPEDISWHLIGHLQRNKVKAIAPFIDMIHSVDSIPLALEINKHAGLNGRKISILLQTHVAQEESKFGVAPELFDDFAGTLIDEKLEHVNVCGIMGMATFTQDEQQISEEFQKIQSLFQSIKTKFFSRSNSFREISIGMSGDYLHALRYGSTMVRIGSAIFEPT